MEIRRYGSEVEFEADAAKMAAVGWRVASKERGSSGIGVGHWALAGFGLMVGLLWFAPALVLLGTPLLGLVIRRPVLVVTYSR